MRKILILIITAAAFVSSCSKTSIASPDMISASVECSYENVRPIAHFTMNDPNYFYPCQIKVDGEVFSAHNASITTIQNISGYSCKLPYMSPGAHTITFIIGNGRKLYRDAEAAFGENIASFEYNINIEACNDFTVAIKNPLVDMDWQYIVTKKQEKPEDKAISEQNYAVQVFPFSLNNDFTIQNIDKGLSVKEIQTTIGKGISVGRESSSTKTGKYFFEIAAGGQIQKICVNL